MAFPSQLKLLNSCTPFAAFPLGIEAVTGRKTSDIRQLRAMLRDAETVLKAGGPRRPPRGYAKPGRISTKPNGDEFERLKEIWLSDDYATNAAAIRAMKKTIVEGTAIAWFGPSGRPVGPRRKRK